MESKTITEPTADVEKIAREAAHDIWTLEAHRKTVCPIPEDQIRGAIACALAQANAPLLALNKGLALWLKASLDCKDHLWEPDQRIAAQELVDAALAGHRENISKQERET